MISFLKRRWFLLALCLVLAVGATAAPALKPLSTSTALRYAIVAAVMFVMALPLEASAMWRALSRPAAPLLGCAVNYGLLPLLAWPVSLLLSADLGRGLLVAAATPCTLASAAVWTRHAGGNDAVAILVTILTNLTCFVMTPLWLSLTMGIAFDSEAADGGALEFRALVFKLALLVVLPMLVAQLLRRWPPVARRATASRAVLGVLAQCGVLSMVLMGAIRTGLKWREAQAEVLALDLAAMGLAVLGVHVAMFWTGMALAGRVGLDREDRIAVAFAGSQKTLMIGLQVSLDLGVSILPMVTYHVGQLLIGTVFADRLRRGS